MKGFLAGMWLVLMTTSVATSQWSGGDVTILRSDERSIVFEYRPRYSPERVVHGGGTEMKVIDFVGSIPTYTKETIGGPDLRYAAIPLGFPAESGNAVQVVASDYEDVAGVILAPVPTMRVKSEMVEIDGYKMSPEKYGASSFTPSQQVELYGPNRARSMWVGSIRVFPVQYNPASRTVRKFTRLVVEVLFGSPNRPRVRNEDDLVFTGALINYDVARNWKFSEQRTLAKVNAAPSVLANGAWYRLTVVDDGVYVLTAPYLRAIGVNPATIDPRSIKIYGNGGKELPEPVLVPRPNDLVENAIYVEGEGDGRFDESDYVIFFAKSVRSWNYNMSSHLLNHYINHENAGSTFIVRQSGQHPYKVSRWYSD
ncbi:MAG: Propeptide protein [Bacteroidetes bacterium]|nr:Propeptide protein [Bacteroidota bacterium]